MLRPPLLRAPQPGLSVLGFLSFKRVILLKPPLFRAPSLAVKKVGSEEPHLLLLTLSVVRLRPPLLRAPLLGLSVLGFLSFKRVLLLKPPLTRAPSLAVKKVGSEEPYLLLLTLSVVRLRPPLLRAPQPGLSVLGFLSFKRVILLKPPLFRAPSLAVIGSRLRGATLTASGVECSQASSRSRESSC